MFRHIARREKWALAVIVLLGILMSLTMPSAEATPFDSPPPGNTIHQPLVTNESGDPVPQPVQIESQGIPLIWIIILLVLLFIPAVAFVAARRR